MTPADFYDGKSAQAKNVTIRKLGHHIVISTEHNSEITIKISDLDIQVQNEIHILTFEDMELHLKSSDYKSLKLKSTFLGKEKKIILKYLTISFFIIYSTWFFYHPVLRFLAGLVPDSFFESTGKMVVETYRPKHCLTPDQNEAIKELFHRLGSSDAMEKTFVIKSSLVNAFVLPGNVIIIHDEIIKQSPSPEALAGILAHELGHIHGNHHKLSLIKNYLVDSVWTMMGNGTIGEIIKIIGQDLLTQVDELEADQLAIKSLREQQISPLGMVAFFEQRKKEEPAFLRYFSFTHPEYDKRIAIFNQRYDTYPVLSPDAWAKLKKACPEK